MFRVVTVFNTATKFTILVIFTIIPSHFLLVSFCNVYLYD